MRTLAAILILSMLALAQSAPKPKPVAPTPGAAATSETFTDAVADDLLSQIATSMAARNARGMLAAFDPQMDGYSVFADHLSVWFHDNTSFKAYYKLRQTAVDGDRGIAVADFEYEVAPREEDQPPVRRHAQLRFTFARGAKGWKITDFTPRNFFS